MAFVNVMNGLKKMDMSARKTLEGKVGIITGSSRGLGKVLAAYCCQLGAKIMLNGRTPSRLEETAKELREKGYCVAHTAADITNEEQVKSLIRNTVIAYGRIDFLINNGSLTMNQPIEDISPKQFLEVYNSNSVGAMLPTLLALPFLKETGGSVVFLSSLAGKKSMPGASAYSAGKMALTSFWESLNIEIQSAGVHSGICYLGFIQNDTEKKMLNAKGEWADVPKRPSWIVQSKEKTAAAIVRMIAKRRKKGYIGKLSRTIATTFYLFPRLTHFLIRRSYAQG